jgi:hypothetical protein
MSHHDTIRVRVQVRSTVAASPNCLDNIDARELVLERLQEEVLDRRIKLLWDRCCSLMQAKQSEEARRYCEQAMALAHSRSPNHLLRCETARGLASAPGVNRPQIGLERSRDAIHA